MRAVMRFRGGPMDGMVTLHDYVPACLAYATFSRLSDLCAWLILDEAFRSGDARMGCVARCPSPSCIKRRLAGRSCGDSESCRYELVSWNDTGTTIDADFRYLAHASG
jgi:hypothetical protein